MSDAPRVAPSDAVLNDAVERMDALGYFAHVPPEELRLARRELWCMLASGWLGGSYSAESDGMTADAPDPCYARRRYYAGFFELAHYDSARVLLKLQAGLALRGAWFDSAAEEVDAAGDKWLVIDGRRHRLYAIEDLAPGCDLEAISRLAGRGFMLLLDGLLAAAGSAERAWAYDWAEEYVFLLTPEQRAVLDDRALALPPADLPYPAECITADGRPAGE